jgi:hypothetical protein
MDPLFSFPVGLFHPLQHAGLSRRTTSSASSARIRRQKPSLTVFRRSRERAAHIRDQAVTRGAFRAPE